MSSAPKTVQTPDRRSDRPREAAFLDLFEAFKPALYRLAGAYTGSAEDREDVVQEIAIALWCALPSHRGDASKRTYVYRIAHNVAFRFSLGVRKRGQRESLPGTLEDVAGRSEDPAVSMVENERLERMREVLRGLPFRDRQIALLHLEGLSHAEIGEASGLTQNAIAVRLSRVRTKLRTALRVVEGEHERRR